ncbi:HesA/MoeB/ThiF family protein [Idiomarina aquatica]|nr:molybdopterin-synthase adenylyltransferase MoeB [Idiomarina aquatica]
MKTLTHEQMLRYNRHIVLPAIDMEGQERLLNSQVVVIGAGGLGCAVLPYLVSAGVGSVTIIDADTIERSNLQRQPLYREQDVGGSKAETAQQQLQQLNSETQLRAIHGWADADTLASLEQPIDLIIDCCDNLTTRNLVNEFCVKHSIPLVSGSAIRFEGQLAAFSMQPGEPCYQCFSRLFGEQSLSCTESGVASPLVGVVGSMQALEALKILTGAGKPLFGQLLMFDGLNAEWQRFKLSPFPNCPACG